MRVAAQAVTGQVSETLKNPPEKQPTLLRVLEVDLEAGSGRMGSFESEWPELEAVASARVDAGCHLRVGQRGDLILGQERGLRNAHYPPPEALEFPDHPFQLLGAEPPLDDSERLAYQPLGQQAAQRVVEDVRASPLPELAQRGGSGVRQRADALRSGPPMNEGSLDRHQ